MNTNRHRLLARQLRKLGLDESRPPDGREWAEMLSMVDRTYRDADLDRYTLERSIEISSEEMRALYQREKSSYETRLKVIFTTLQDLVWLKDADGVYLACNPMFERFFGATEAEIVGKTDYDFVPKEQADFFREHDRMAAEADVPTANEEWVTFADDGHRALLETVKTPMRDASGQLVGVLGIARDVTQRKRIEEALRESEATMAAILENVSAYIYLKDSEGRYLFVNRMVLDLWGRTREEVTGFGDEKFFDEQTVAKIREVDSRVLRDGQIVRCEETNTVATTGETRTYWSVKLPMRREDGEIYALCGISTDITELKSAERLLSRYKTVIEASIDGYFVSDASGRVIEANDAYAQMSGYPREELQGRYVSQLEATEQSPEEVRAHMRKIIEQGHDRFASRHRRKDDSEFDVEVSVTYLAEDRQFHVFLRDITERKLAEQAVRSSMEKLNEAQRIAQVGNWELDLVGGHLSWSDEIFRLFEIDKAQFGTSYEAFLNAIHPDDREAVNLAYSRSLETREPYEIAHRLLMADGRIKWVNERCETFYDEQGKAMRSVGTVQDVTERKLIEDALRQSETYNKLLFADSRVAMVVIDAATGRYIDCNQAAVEIYGLPSRESVIGLTPLDVSDSHQYYGGDSATEARSRVAQALESGSVAFEWRHRRPDGKVWDGRVNLMRLQQNDKIYLLFTLEDITEQKRIGEELRSKTEALQRSNSDLERFAYSVSHDMRQPLRAVSGHLQLLARSLKDKLDDDERENMNFALEGAKRMDSMIVSLLDYSRVGRKTEAMALLSSRATLDEALGFLEPLMRDTAAEVSVGGEWPQVYASRDELTRLFQNLVGNGIKFCEAGKTPRVEVESGIAGDNWRVTVRDHGIGIDPQQIDRLFQFFSRLQSRTRFDGTGMGLALCRRIVEHHGGRIWVESEGEGKGSTFSFEMPLNGNVEGGSNA